MNINEDDLKKAMMCRIDLSKLINAHKNEQDRKEAKAYLTDIKKVFRELVLPKLTSEVKFMMICENKEDKNALNSPDNSFQIFIDNEDSFFKIVDDFIKYYML